jgi:hypothetical protein
VVTVNLADVDPDNTVTEVGTPTLFGLPLASLTTQPPAGATEVRVTIPVEDLPPFTNVGLTIRPDIDSPFTIKMADLPDKASLAVILAE